MKMALQIYSVRRTLLADIAGHMEQIKAMGYDGVELVDFGDDSIARMTAEMQRVGLEVFSIHTDISEMKKADEEKVKYYASLGCKYMPIGWLPPEHLAGGEKYAETLETVRNFSALCKKYGIRLLYHNHDFDFVYAGEKHRLDCLYADLPGDVLGAELDTCWVYSGKEDPLDYLHKYGDRCPVLHVKDCVKEGGRAGFRALGEGVLDFAPIVACAKELDIPWLCVEQDEPDPESTAMQCAQRSAAYLKKLL